MTRGDLNARQREAVDAPLGGLFIDAAAGSGKTRALTARYARLVSDQVGAGAEAPLDTVCAITFTDRAAGELISRIRGALAPIVGRDVARHADAAWISTVHGLCSRILRRHAFEAGIDPGFTVADEVTSKALAQHAFEETVLEAGETSAPVAALLDGYGVLALAEAIPGLLGKVRSLGLPAEALRQAPFPVRERLDAALPLLRSALDELRPYARKGVAAYARNAETLASAISELSAIDPGTGGVSERILRALHGVRLRANGAGPPKRIACEVVNPLLAEVRDVAAAEAVRPYADAVVELVAAFGERYALAKAGCGVLDFEDLESRTLGLLHRRTDIAARYRSQFVEVLVDEFQDTDPLQLRIVEAIAGADVTTVGDATQSIYGFRDADVELFLRRRASLPSGRIVRLPQNYRSHQELLRFYNGIFSRAPFWPGRYGPLEYGTAGQAEEASKGGPWPAGEPRVRIVFVDRSASEDRQTEADVLAEHLAALRPCVPQGDMVLLLRAMTSAEVFERALRVRGFDVHIASGGAYFDTPEVRELGMLLRAIANPGDDEAIATLLLGRACRLSEDAVYLLRLHAGRGRLSLWEALAEGDRAGLAADEADNAARLRAVIERSRAERGRTPLYDLIHDACEAIDLDLTLFAMGRPRAWANALKFARLAGDLETVAPGDPGAFLEHVAIRSRHKPYEAQAPTAVEGVDAVRIMSVHAAKGLEFPVVAVAELGRGMPDDRGPVLTSSDQGAVMLGVRSPEPDPATPDGSNAAYAAVKERRREQRIEEEKRILYVACTRASRGLILTGRTKSASEARSDLAVGWVREALGMEGAGTLRPGVVNAGGTGVAVEVTGAPRKCEPVSERPCAISRAALGILRDRQAVPPGEEHSRPRTISYSGLAQYRSCAYRYYIERVARLRTPASASAAPAVRFGISVHDALRASRRGAPLSEQRLKAIADGSGLDSEERRRLKRAVDALLCSPLLEEVEASDCVGREVPFAVLVGDTLLEGAMDLLGRDGSEALVVDYKTGTEGFADEESGWYELQAACCALALLRDGATRVRVVFVKPERACETRELTFEGECEADIEQDILGSLDAMADGRFEPLKRYDHGACGGCPALGTLCGVSSPLP